MGFWTTMVGTVVGGIVGGPLGAGIGAGLGALVGEYDSAALNPNTPPILPLDLEWVDDDDGRLFTLKPNFQKGNITKVVMMAFDRETGVTLKGHGLYANNTGDFFVSVDWVNDGDGLFLYIPNGAISIERDMSIGIRVMFGGDALVGVSNFNVNWLVKPYSRAHVLRPVIGLAMRVARADGRLDREEIAHLRAFLVDQFELSSEEQIELRNLMKLEPSAPVEVQVNQFFLRLPWVDIGALFELLIEIAKADGEVYASELAVLSDIALKFGIPEAKWSVITRGCNLISLEERLDVAYSELGLKTGADLQAVKSAYRVKMKDYHPDKVASLPIEFRELAENKSKAINLAYDFIMSKFSI